MTIATGVFKQLVMKKQSALGTKATAGSAQIYRRVTSSIDLVKDTYKSNEIRPSMQRSDFRHGVRSVAGTINGELSVGTYSEIMASVLREAWAATSAYAAGTDVTAAATAPHFVDASAGFLTAGLKVGMVGRWTGFVGATANNDRNFLITALTAGDMTGIFLDGTAVVADAAGDSVTFTPLGKSISIPVTAHTRDYWTIEHNFADIVQSEQFTDCVFGSMDIKLPATGMATVDFPVLGLDVDTSTAAYFTTPTDVSSGGILAAVNGAVYVAGVEVGYITSLDINVNGNQTLVGGVVGSNVQPDITPGSFDVTGNMTVLFSDAVMRDYFLNETEVSVVAAFTTDNTATAGVQTYIMPRVKVGGASKDDGEKGLIMAMPFTALENTAGGSGAATNATTLTIQDSAVA